MGDGNGNGFLSLKAQWALLQRVAKAKQKGGWDQEAADEIGHYMLDNGIRSMALNGYFGEVSDDGCLYVAEVPVLKYGVPAYLHYEYTQPGSGARR